VADVLRSSAIAISTSPNRGFQLCGRREGRSARYIAASSRKALSDRRPGAKVNCVNAAPNSHVIPLMLDFMLALRGVRRNPWFAVLVIGTMATGIGACTVMYSLVRAVLLRPLPFSGQDRLVTLWEQDSAMGTADRRVTPANFVDWRAQSTAFEEMGVLPNWSGPSLHFNIVGPGGAERVDQAVLNDGFPPASPAAAPRAHSSPAPPLDAAVLYAVRCR
jgi:hypothetical protein